MEHVATPTTGGRAAVGGFAVPTAAERKAKAQAKAQAEAEQVA